MSKMSRWSRDLANRDLDKFPHALDHLTADQIPEAMEAQVHCAPTQAEHDQAMLAAMKEKDANKRADLLESIERDFVARTAAADEFDPETVAAAVAGAQAAAKSLGGEAHVHLTGTTRLDGDKTSGHYGAKLQVVQITVTKITPATP